MVASLFVDMVVKLHSFPKSIVSDRDPIFLSKFRAELFKFSGTSFAISSAYHPQTDGQTEVLNRCLEQYLRAFVMDQPSRWFRFLSWAELCYNTTFHSSIRMTPFEDKVLSHGVSNVTSQEELGKSQQRPSRMRSAPRSLVDFTSE